MVDEGDSHAHETPSAPRSEGSAPCSPDYQGVLIDNQRDEELYSRDRPPHPTLPEDRPRGAKPKAPVKHRSPWLVAAFVIGVIALIVIGIALFP